MAQITTFVRTRSRGLHRRVRCALSSKVLRGANHNIYPRRYDRRPSRLSTTGIRNIIKICLSQFTARAGQLILLFYTDPPVRDLGNR